MTGPFEVIFSTRGGKGAFFFLLMMAMIAVAVAGLEVGPICDSDLDCLDGWMEGTYCAGGECLEYSQCKTGSDCYNPSNIYGKIECVGYVECQVDGTCGVVCGSQCKDGSDWVNCFVDPCDVLGVVDSSTTMSGSSTTATRNIDPSVCGSPADSCMNDSNFGQCVGLINDGCQQLMTMESCPLQFACGDQNPDVDYCENLLATEANCMNDDNYNECVSLVVDQGCQNVVSLESCPLQFACDDDIQDHQDATGALCDVEELQTSVSCVADYCGGCHALHFDSKGSLLCAGKEMTSSEDTDDPLPCDEASNSNDCTNFSQYCASNGFCADYYSCIVDSDCSNGDNVMALASYECSNDSGVECQDGTCKTYCKDNSESSAVDALPSKPWMLLVAALIVGVATID